MGAIWLEVQHTEYMVLPGRVDVTVAPPVVMVEMLVTV